jgi:peptidoglycan/LPS O-acetylase OafA/YrhL
VTGVRFVAASHVVLLHYLPPTVLAVLPLWAQGVVGAGYVGVDLFFILSGFVLAYIYLRPHGESQVAPRGFWVARLARVYPLYALSIAIAVPFWIQATLAQYPLSMRSTAVTLFTVGAMLQAWSPGLATVVNYPAWSLSIEAFFYLTFPLLAVRLSRIVGRRLWLAAAVLWLAALVPPAVYVLTNPDGIGMGVPDHYVRWLRVVIYNPVMRLPEFLFGVVLGLAFLRHVERPRVLDSRWLGIALTVLPVVAIVVVLSFSSHLPFALLHNGLLAPLFGCLIFGLAIGRGPVAWVLGRPLLVLLGDASYAVYLLQDPLWNVVVAATRPFVAPGSTADRWAYYWGHPWLSLVFAALLVGVSAALFPLFQEPARRWLIRRFAPGRPELPATTALAITKR